MPAADAVAGAGVDGATEWEVDPFPNAGLEGVTGDESGPTGNGAPWYGRSRESIPEPEKGVPVDPAPAPEPGTALPACDDGAPVGAAG